MLLKVILSVVTCMLHGLIMFLSNKENNMKTAHVIYHSTDTDGRTSAMIAKRYYDAIGVETQFIGGAYANEELRIDAKEGDVVVVVDYSLPLEAMRALDKEFDLIWIDHHPVINQYTEKGFNPKGLRGTEHSAAWYTWRYFFPEEEVPEYVALTSDYDTWQHQLPDSHAFNAAAYAYGLHNVWEFPYKQLEDPDYLDQMIGDGKEMLRTIEVRNQCVSEFIFETEIAGIPAIAINMRGTNSTVFAAYKGDYDYKVMITFGSGNADSEDVAITLYSRAGSDIHVGKIAESFGGGGHPGAAGFRCKWDELPFLVDAKGTDTPPSYNYMAKLDELFPDEERSWDNTPYKAFLDDHRRTEKSFGFDHELGRVVNSPWWVPTNDRTSIAWSFHKGRYLYRIFVGVEGSPYESYGKLMAAEIKRINEYFGEHQLTKINEYGYWLYSSSKLI